MATANVNICIDSALKQEAEALFDELGLTMTSAITVFLRSAVNHNGLPFEVKRFVPNAETKAALDEYEEMKKNPGSYKRYESFDEAVREGERGEYTTYGAFGELLSELDHEA